MNGYVPERAVYGPRCDIDISVSGSETSERGLRRWGCGVSVESRVLRSVGMCEGELARGSGSGSGSAVDVVGMGGDAEMVLEQLLWLYASSINSPLF